MNAPRDPSRKRIVDVVFDRSPQTKLWPLGISVFAAASIHAGLMLTSVQNQDSALKEWIEIMTAKVHAQMVKEIVVEAPPPPPPEPPKPVLPVAKPPPTKSVQIAKSPAKAAQVIAQTPDPNTPVDMSDAAFVTGSADSYAGGVTASNGTSDQAVDANDQSRAVSLDEKDWNCGWPSAAESQSINEQSAVIKVVVQSDGSVESATIVSDPGSGFGTAARICALNTRFKPALNAKGEPILAESPPIRVRFTR